MTSSSTSSASTFTTMGYKRLREGNDVEENPAKKAKTESASSILNPAEILATLKNLGEQWNTFASTYPQNQEFIHEQVTQLTQVQQSLTHVFQNSQYHFDEISILLKNALNNKDISAIFSYLDIVIKHNDLERLLKTFNSNLLPYLDLSLEAAHQKSSQEMFSALIQAIHHLRPSLLSDPLLMSKMRKIFYTEECADLKLIICSKQDHSQSLALNVNKTYLGAVSPYFYGMFFGDHGCKEKEQTELKLVIEDLQSLVDVPLTQENVYDVLRYCHTHTIFFRGAKECLAILLLAEKWQIKSLTLFCNQYLQRSIDQLTDAFEAVWEIATATSCSGLKTKLLEWAASQKLQGKELDPDVLKKLSEEKDQVKSLDLSFPLSDNQLLTIPLQFPKVHFIQFRKLEKQELERQIPILQKLTTLNALHLEDVQLTKKCLQAIPTTQLQVLKLINCDFEETDVAHLNTNTSQLRQPQPLNSFNKIGFQFLEQCTNLIALQLHVKKYAGNHFVRLNKLTKLRGFDFYTEAESATVTYALPYNKWTHLEGLKWNVEKFEDDIAELNRLPPHFRKAYNPKDLTLQDARIKGIVWPLRQFDHFKIFQSNVIITENSTLNDILHHALTQLSLTTAMDPNRDFRFFCPRPSLHTLQWNCSGLTPVINLLKTLINIQNFHLKNAKLDDSILVQLEQLSRLDTLHCEEITNLDDDCLARLAQLPWLESLTLTKCDLITDQGLRSLLSSENLQKVIIQDCVNISEKGTILVKECRQMREFAFSPFEQKNWTCERAYHVLSIKPTHLQALDFLNTSPDATEDVKAILKAIELEPMQSIHWKCLSLAYLKHGKVEGSLEAYQRAIQFGENGPKMQEIYQKIHAALMDKIQN